MAAQPTLRVPDGEHVLGRRRPLPRGPDAAHIVRNDAEEPVRVLIASTTQLPEAAVYPDSGKVGIWTGHNAHPPRLFRIGDAVG